MRQDTLLGAVAGVVAAALAMLGLALLSADLVGPVVIAAVLATLVVAVRRSPPSPTLVAAAISAAITVLVV